jgi:hypothetical protein
MTAAVHSDRSINPIELINVLAGSHVGEIVNTDVPNTTLVSDFINLIVTQLAITIEIHEAYHLYKDEVMLDTTKTLEESGVVANDIVHLRVTVYLT